VAAPEQVLAAACEAAGLPRAGAEPIRLGENAIFRLPGRVVVRIARPGQLATAGKEIRIAGWLAGNGIPAATAAAGITQPVEVDGHAVTFWDEIPPHRHGTVAEIAGALRRLHRLRPPTDLLEPLDPFVRVQQRIDAASTLDAADREWLAAHLAGLRERYARRPAGLPDAVIHGDAWKGNVVGTADGCTVLLDLERFAVGPPEWDLTSTAVRRTSFGWLTAAEYADFCRRYGHDVTAWSGYDLLRDIRELRMTSYRLQRADEDPAERSEAAHRLACLRGRHGPRPWPWAT
jgi:aminoglycoside phosphotransferase